MSRLETIRALMKEAGNPTLRSISEAIDVDHSRLSRYLNGIGQPRNDEVWEKWEAFLVSLISKRSEGRFPQQLRPLAPMPMVRIPIVATAKGGRGDSDQIDDSLEVPVTFSQPDYRALVALGDSQADEILGGDTIIVKQTPERKPRVISCILVGSELLLKKLEWNSKENRWEMLSKNGAYPPEPLPLDAVIQGYVVGVYRTDGSGIGFDMKYDPTGLRFGSW
jgi:SOS-response transcriptional repressor LexA